MQVLFEAFGLGIIAGIIPGSILTILLVSVIQGGFHSGLRVFLWSLAAELTVVGVLLIVLFTLPIPQYIFNYLGLIGGFVLFYFAWQIFHLYKIDQPEKTHIVFSGKQIYSLASTNAPLYIFWVTVCAPLIWKLANHWTLPISTLSFMVSFELGWILSTFLIMLLFVKARQYLTNTNVMRKVYIGASVLMLLLGTRMLILSFYAF